MTVITNFFPILPYRFDLTMGLISRFAHPSVDIVDISGMYWRVLRTSTGTLTLWRVTADLQVDCIAQTGNLSAEDEAQALATLAHILALDHNPTSFLNFARQHPQLWQIIEPIAGIRWLRTPTVFEALVNVIIEQHISWVAAQKYQRALVEWVNQRIDYNGHTYYAFPTPAQLASATVDQLDTVKITRKRRQMLIDLSAQIVSGELDIERLRELPYQDAYQALMKLKGVGHWTAANVIVRALGVFPYIPDADVALQAAANHYFNGAKGKLSPAELRALYEGYGEFGGIAAYYTLLRYVMDFYEIMR